MQSDFNKWVVPDLKTLLLQYNIDLNDIKGSGKYGNVVKADLVKAVKKIKMNTELLMSNEDNDFLNLPIDMINEIINLLDVNSIIHFCNTSLTFNKYCTEDLWKKIAIREEMPIHTANGGSTVTEWIKEYLYHQYEVNILIQMLKDKVLMAIDLPSSYLSFDKENIILYNGYILDTGYNYFINNTKFSEQEITQLFMKLLYQFPNVYIYRYPKIKINMPLRKHHLKYFINQSILMKRTKSKPYKNAMTLWNKYYV